MICINGITSCNPSDYLNFVFRALMNANNAFALMHVA